MPCAGRPRWLPGPPGNALSSNRSPVAGGTRRDVSRMLTVIPNRSELHPATSGETRGNPQTAEPSCLQGLASGFILT